ncbi:16S rRNA (cytosine(1402)-N(4))-methyltransferase RsmH [Kaarinaea lacus]
MNGIYTHQPVLLKEVLEALEIKQNGIYIDGTFGRGGHAQAILGHLGTQGQLFAMDKDPDAVAAARQLFANEPRFSIERGSFALLEQYAEEKGWLGRVDGILLDLGVSSPQLDDAQRGFSFKRDGALDMRMDPQVGQSAAEWINQVDEAGMAKVFRDYGEERYAKRIARAIVAARRQTPITGTKQLADIIAAAHPAWEQGKDPATRCFQAIRIFINNELQDLQTCLPQSVNILSSGGRLAVISFHSLEDRIIKRFIRDQSRGDDFPPDLPVTQAQLTPKLKAVGKAIYASEDEVTGNPRARSAVLRVAERI